MTEKPGSDAPEAESAQDERPIRIEPEDIACSIPLALTGVVLIGVGIFEAWTGLIVDGLGARILYPVILVPAGIGLIYMPIRLAIMLSKQQSQK